jgi:hypothetical protein
MLLLVSRAVICYATFKQNLDYHYLVRNADVRIKAKVSEYESVLAHVYNKVANAAGVATVSAPALREDIKLSVEGVANELITAGSGSLVLNGLNSASAEKLAAKTNELLASAAFNTVEARFYCDRFRFGFCSAFRRY